MQPPEDSPITDRQSAFLTRLIVEQGKAAYLAAKRLAGIPAETTLLRLTKGQASRLIDILNGGQR